MIRKISMKLLRIILRIAFLPFLLLFGFITLPLTIFFRWNGWFILGVAFEELCSLSEAKRLYLERDDDNEYEEGFSFTSYHIDESNRRFTDPTYKCYPENIHYEANN